MDEWWYVLRTKPHKERTVFRQLQAKGVTVYFPALHVTPTNPRAAKIRPFFPGYMFVQLDLESEGDNALRWLPGTNGLVRFGKLPATVPDQLIRELQRRVAQIEAEGETPEEKLTKGDRVRVVEGPFAGYEAIFDMRLSGRDRVQVFLSLVNREGVRRLQLNEGNIEKVG